MRITRKLLPAVVAVGALAAMPALLVPGNHDDAEASTTAAASAAWDQLRTDAPEVVAEMNAAADSSRYMRLLGSTAITEDDARWNCATMGNLDCGSAVTLNTMLATIALEENAR